MSVKFDFENDRLSFVTENFELRAKLEVIKDFVAKSKSSKGELFGEDHHCSCCPSEFVKIGEFDGVNWFLDESFRYDPSLDSDYTHFEVTV
jgi:hypothetical protein